jgi:hypothetical protein
VGNRDHSTKPLFKRTFQSFLRPLSGSYRLIVFTVRDKPSEGGGEAVTSERAEVLSLEGSNTLPDEPFRRFARA